MLTVLVFPLIKVVGIKFPLYDETPREDFMPTFIPTVFTNDMSL